MLILFCLLSFSCKNEEKKAPVEVPPKEVLIQKHQNRIQTEEDRINAYIKRRNWSMLETGSGLRYRIVEKGSGPSAKEGMRAFVNYKISLLNGSLCYASTEEPESFIIGHDAVESGLHEGIQYLNEGDKAVLIMPPHLAHGLIGDRDKIPANASLVFEIDLLKLEQ